MINVDFMYSDNKMHKIKGIGASRKPNKLKHKD